MLIPYLQLKKLGELELKQTVLYSIVSKFLPASFARLVCVFLFGLLFCIYILSFVIVVALPNSSTWKLSCVVTVFSRCTHEGFSTHV